MIPTSPPGTVPLMIYRSGNHEHVYDIHVFPTTCAEMGCRCIGFLVVDEQKFEAWRKELKA